ncbi:MAG: 1-acyl-sn-glycerol-3-phosphate acyltransferase [Phycisphaeraceae bacterium]|nr:1-acyl-sn-glycerol-3-phosphate acyltransferase [Phycisphaeraceae bacterium]
MRRWRYESARDLGLGRRARFASVRREIGVTEWLLHHLACSTLRLLLGGFEHLEVVGRDRLPARPPFVVVSNHCSHLDALALSAALPMTARDRLFPIAAADTFFNSPSATIMATHLLNALPIRRGGCGAHAIADLRKRLMNDPCGYILFPEGTRSRTGALGPFRPGIGMLVAGLDVPVVPCHLGGTFAAWPPHRPVPAAGHVQVWVGSALRFDDVRNDRAGWEHIAHQLEATVRSLGDRASASISGSRRTIGT